MTHDALLDTGTMGRIILSAIARYGPRQAVRDDDRAVRYDELGGEIARAITVLTDAGLRRGDGIAVLSSNRVELLVAEFAAMLIGARYTPLHPMAASDSHLFVINDAEVSLLIVDAKALRYPLAGVREAAPGLTAILAFGAIDGALDMLGSLSTANPAPLADNARSNDLVRLLYTGGTTGRPKGVMMPHRTMVSATVLQATEWDLPADPHFLAVTPISHASGAIVPTVLMQGGSVRLTNGFDADRFCRIIADERISMTFLVPTMIYVLLDHPGIEEFDLGSLRTIVYGASPMSPDRLVRAIECFGRVFVQLYGQTEVPNCITTLRKSDHDPANSERLKSCGLPSPLVQISLRDAEEREVADGEPGQICIRGPLVSNGYWKQPDANAAAFRDGWLHTGDIAVRSSDGFYAIVDRTSDLIISGGFNVYPSEIEDVLHAHADVAMAAVVGLPDEKWGEAVTAFVVSRSGSGADAEALMAHVKRLRGAVWTPKAIHFVDAIPLTALGKIDRKALRQRQAH